MTPELEKKIEEASIIYARGVVIDYSTKTRAIAFIAGAKSLEAKEYWQQRMYTEEETEKLVGLFGIACQEWVFNKLIGNQNILCPRLLTWFEQNKKQL